MDGVEARLAEGNWLPLSGHILFASIRWKQIDELELQKNIQRLGGKLETFFSNEITCVLTDELTVPVRRDNKILKRNQNGKLLSQKSKQNCIIDKAKSLGIQVMRIDTFLTWLRPHANVHLKSQDVKKISKLNKTTKLNGCFMKIESASQNYSPVYKVYSDPPDVEFEKLFYTPVEDQLASYSNSSTKSKSTFSVNIKIPQLVKVDENLQSPEDGKAVSSLSSSEPVKNNNKAKRHYCECCKMYYSCLENHLKGPQHLKYISNTSNFCHLMALTSEMNSISEIREKCVFSESEIDPNIKTEQECSNSEEDVADSTEFEQKLVEIMKCKDYMSSDNLNEILKVELFGSSTMEKDDLERELPLSHPQDINHIFENEVVAEKTVFKDLNFSDFIPTDILPDNDRLFSSDASDNESIQQNVLHVIQNVFNEESSNDNPYLISHSKTENCVNKLGISSVFDQTLLERTRENSHISQQGSKEFKNFGQDSWTIKPISEIKMIFVRCSVLPQVPTLQLANGKEYPCDPWIVKDIKDTKLILRRSKFSVAT